MHENADSVLDIVFYSCYRSNRLAGKEAILLVHEMIAGCEAGRQGLCGKGCLI